MKKIILFSMAAMLLSLSLNAQLVPDNGKHANAATKTANNQRSGKVFEKSGSDASFNSSHGKFGALGADEYCFGAFNDYISTYSTPTNNHIDDYVSAAGEVYAGIQLTKEEIQAHFGDQVVGFRFAVNRTPTVYRFFCYKGDNQYIDSELMFEYTFGTNGTSMSTGWHEYRLPNPVDFTLTDDQNSIWFGIDYNQEWNSQYYRDNVAINTNSVTHDAMVLMNYNGSYGVYSLDLGGDLCVQLIMKAKPTADAPEFSMDENYTITGSCDNSYHVYINGVEVTLPYTVEQTSEEQTIVVTGYGYGNGMKNSATVSYTFIVPAMAGPAGYKVLPGTYGDAQTINFTGILFCDQPSGDTHENAHPAKYTYWLQEVPANAADSVHKTNTIDIPVYKTDSKVKGFYTAAEVAADTDHQLTVDVVNADVEMTLENESMIYFYSLDRDKTKVPETRIARIQNNANADGLYQEMSDELYYMGETYTATQSAPAQVHRWDGKTVMTGAVNEAYMSYIPVIWSWGDGTFNNKRNDWDDNGVHNSYGAPYYKTGVGDVTFNASTQVIAQTAGSSTATWTDGTDECCLYNVVIDANGYLPTAVNSVEYEPYMFRVWVEGDGLRNYTTDDDGKFYPASGTPSEVLLYEGDAPSCIEPNISRLSVGSTGDYSSWIAFGAVQDCTPTLRVRFYYKVAGEDASSSLMLPSAGQALYYAVEEANFTPQIVTGVIETLTGAQPVSTTYVNMQGMQSSTPFDGVNIVVTRYSDGSTTTAKVVK